MAPRRGDVTVSAFALLLLENYEKLSLLLVAVAHPSAWPILLFLLLGCYYRDPFVHLIDRLGIRKVRPIRGSNVTSGANTVDDLFHRA